MSTSKYAALRSFNSFDKLLQTHGAEAAHVLSMKDLRVFLADVVTYDTIEEFNNIQNCGTDATVQLNANKSEVMILGTPAQLRSADAVFVVDVAVYQSRLI